MLPNGHSLDEEQEADDSGGFCAEGLRGGVGYIAHLPGGLADTLGCIPVDVRAAIDGFADCRDGVAASGSDVFECNHDAPFRPDFLKRLSTYTSNTKRLSRGCDKIVHPVRK
jgi:hypothetical protein